MQIDQIRALLEKYQQGLCTAEERKIIDEWYSSLQLGREEGAWENIGDSLEKIRGNLRELTGQTAAGAPPTGEPVVGTGVPVAGETLTGNTTSVIHPYRWRKAWMTACAVLATLLAGSVWLLFHQPGHLPPVAANLNNTDTTVITNRGETKQIVLPDGSTIQLNAGTEFRYPKSFSHTERTVALVKGEAFFQVVSDPARPFTVINGKWRTAVLGTSFDIRDYGNGQGTEIALLTGKIRVSGEKRSQSIVLLPHQLIKIGQDTGEIQPDKFVNDYEVAAWKEGAMHFKDASFGDIAFEIGNKYNVVLINRSDKQHWSYTGLFRNESLQEVVETLCQTENLSYRFTDQGILIFNKK
jgi:ferric-dicitrate binding protein FerR (iron transport regulator)